MRYIVVSDVHSSFDALIEELERVKFDPKKDCLVSDGDLFDRGDKPLECLEYVMALPHKILLFGNHELELMRLIKTGQPEWFDFHNMTTDTLLKLANAKDENFTLASKILKDKKNSVSKLLNKYFDQCHYAAVFDKFIVTHAWLPTENGDDYTEIIKPEWDLSTKEEWHNACWTNPINRCNSGAYYDGKTLILGHRHAWTVAENYGEKRLSDDEKSIDASPYAIAGKMIDSNDGWTTTSKKAVFIDGMAAYREAGGRVNAFVIHSSRKPLLVDAIPEYEYEILDD